MGGESVGLLCPSLYCCTGNGRSSVVRLRLPVYVVHLLELCGDVLFRRLSDGLLLYVCLKGDRRGDRERELDLLVVDAAGLFLGIGLFVRRRGRSSAGGLEFLS